MKWIEYEYLFRAEASKNNKDNNYCDKWLGYAKNIYDQGIPIIYSTDHFSKLVGFSLYYLYSVSNSSSHFYRYFLIKKKSGGYRKIAEPLPNLKEIQNWILREILNKRSYSQYSKAFIKGKSVKDNARFHRKQHMVMTLDIHDYFGSIKYGRVLHFFKSLGYLDSVAVLIANLCTLDGSLPQGAPTSPMLSNLITASMDEDIAEQTIPYGIRYTRYADDMTFSGDFDAGKIYTDVSRILKKYGFRLNSKKTRVRKEGQQQEVTGIVVNEKMQVSKKERKAIRQAVYYIKKYGLQEHVKHISLNDKEKYLDHLIGKVEFAVFVNPNDQELKTYRAFLHGLRG